MYSPHPNVLLTFTISVIVFFFLSLYYTCLILYLYLFFFLKDNPPLLLCFQLRNLFKLNSGKVFSKEQLLFRIPMWVNGFYCRPVDLQNEPIIRRLIFWKFSLTFKSVIGKRIEYWYQVINEGMKWMMWFGSFRFFLG